MDRAHESRVTAFAKLVDALPDLLAGESREAVCRWLSERQVLLDGQEDPGAVMTEGLDTELAIAATFRRIAESLGCGDPP